MWANNPAEIKQQDQKALLGDFLKRMRMGYSRSKTFLEDAGIVKAPVDLRGLPEGEPLIFEVVLPEGLKLEANILSQVGNNTILFSLRDVIATFNFPIEYDETSGFSGWYIRESQNFELIPSTRTANINGADYRLSPDTIVQDDDVLVSLEDLESWFKLDIAANVGTQQLIVDPEQPLPIMERYRREKYEFRSFARKPASLPRGDDDYRLIGTPLMDVNTASNLTEDADGSHSTRHQVNVSTSNEFAYGTLSTNISGNNTDKITNMRATYLRESVDPELLGPLKARRFEAGDVTPTRVPIIGGASPETGFRLTNVDPIKGSSLPSTQISGYILPEWDVELYRDNSLIDFIRTDQNGYYSFEDVSLFSDENSFRVVAYGPQGEVREETISVPFDTSREARGETIYDVSVTSQNRQFYQKFESLDQDKNTPHVVGYFEKAIGGNTAMRFGGRYRQEEGENKLYASTGVSTTYMGTLINADIGADEKGEFATELSAARRFGKHNFRADLEFATDQYNPGQSGTNVQTFLNRYALNGPLPLPIGTNPRYAANISYDENSNGESSIGAAFNTNTTLFNMIGVNNTLNYSDSSTSSDPIIRSVSSLSGRYGKHSLRGISNYNISPERQLESLTASWGYRYKPELDSEIRINRKIEDGLNQYSAQLNWRPEFATITPRISYDSNGVLEGRIDTRFGITHVPESNDFVFSRDFVTGSGTITAFVYLDNDGNLEFNEGDEKLPDVSIRTPQNGSGGKTNEDGVAVISRLRPSLVTDVYVELGSLEDPFWIQAKEGVSIMPRTGTNVRLDIPIHVAGEIDGTVYVKDEDGGTFALRNARLALYNADGEVEQSTVAGPDGFYIFSLIPPGEYALQVLDSGIPKGISRPKPQVLKIAHDGTTIYANDIILQSGSDDIPTDILADLEDYKKYHPHIDFSKAHSLVLNLGDFNSRLLTSLVWYKLNARYSGIFAGADLYVPPSESYANARTGKHTLRVGLNSESLNDAYNRCRALIARNIYCKVEIFPGAKKQQLAQNALDDD